MTFRWRVPVARLRRQARRNSRVPMRPARLPSARPTCCWPRENRPRLRRSSTTPSRCGPRKPGASLSPRPPRRGQQLLAEARALYSSGNYPAARQMAEEAKTGKLGLDAQADELLAQIGLAEQGGALSLYESALAAMRGGDNARARALLTEV